MQRHLAFLLLLLLSLGTDTPHPRQVYVPLLFQPPRPASPYGFEFGNSSPKMVALGADLNAKWLRVDSLSWNLAQSRPGIPYDWSKLTRANDLLHKAHQGGYTPIVIVNESPPWATITGGTCGAIRQERLQDFAAFMEAAVRHYSKPPFDVHYWEMGNEPDVDPQLLPPNSGFGCWGDRDDPFYGGRVYGEMLKIVTPRMKAIDPAAKIIIGGLLLSNPNTPTLNPGRPESFLAGILEAGADPFFDFVGYHSWVSFYGSPLNYTDNTTPWAAYGGIIKGKPAFLRSIMDQYGVSKPLMATEIAMRCPRSQVPTVCTAPTDAYTNAQATHVLRGLVPSLSIGVDVLIWYTLDYEGFDSSSLLDSNQDPRPAFYAYRELIRQTAVYTTTPIPIDYGAGIEAYRFTAAHATDTLDILWSTDTIPNHIVVPADQIVLITSRDGTPITPTIHDHKAVISVPYTGIYLRRIAEHRER